MWTVAKSEFLSLHLSLSDITVFVTTTDKPLAANISSACTLPKALNVGGSMYRVRRTLIGFFVTGICLVVAACATPQAPTQIETNAAPRTVASMPRLNTGFELNRGQTDERVRYLSRGRSSVLFLTDAELVMKLRISNGRTRGASNVFTTQEKQVENTRAQVVPLQQAVLRMRFTGANDKVKVTGEGELKTTTKYYSGADRKAWEANVSGYGMVQYRDLYPGIDMQVSHEEGLPKYGFKVAAGADPEAIQFSFSGASDLRLDRSGDLIVATAAGELRHSRPIFYQRINGKKVKVDGRFELTRNRIGFQIESYDRAEPLLIDPVVSFSATFGGSQIEPTLGAIAIGPGDIIYVAGNTASTDFPETNTEDFADHFDAYVATFDLSDPAAPGAGTPLNVAILASSGQDGAYDIAVDNSGNAYVVGRVAASPTLPVP